MKHLIFTFLLAAGLVVVVAVALEPAQSETADADALVRLRQSYGDFPFLRSSYRFERLDLFKRVVEKISNDYVDDSRVDPAEMLDSALNYAGRAVPEVMFDYEPGDAVIHGIVGAVEEDIKVGKLSGIRDLSRVMEDVAVFLAANVPEDTEMPELEYALINGVLSTLDPHSVFIDPESFEEMSINNEGEFGGLGITIGIRKNRLTILYPLADTPAGRAGLRKQDRIIRIGKESTVNMSLEEAVSKLRGAPDTEITITIERDDDEGTREFEVTLVREIIHIESVKYAYLGEGIGGVQVVHFSQNTFQDLETALIKLEQQAKADGYDGVEGLVLDLRDNPGGYLSQAIHVSDKFLESGVVVSTMGHGRQRGELHEATRYGTEGDIRLAVLVDSGSASASEIFAGAIRNLDRGVIIGVTTFGKGSVQNLYPFHADGSALKLTIDKYFTPGGYSIQSVGITPDIELRPVWVEDEGDLYFYWQDAMMREKDLDDHLASGDTSEPSSLTCLYLDPDNPLWSEEYDRDQPDDMEAWGEEFQVQFAKTVLRSSTSTDRRRMLTEAYPAVQQIVADETAKLIERFAEVGVDWSGGEARGTPRAKVSMEVGNPDGKLSVGDRTPVTLTVTNVGDGPFVRLRAMAESELIDGREFLFGRIEPGQSRSWSIQLEPGLGMNARTDEVTFHFYAEGSRAPGDYVAQLMVDEKPRPRFAYNYRIIDDGSGKSRGNGDGLIQRGEEIDLLVTVKNIGEGPTGDVYLAGPEAAADALPVAPGGPAGGDRDVFLDVPGDRTPDGLDAGASRSPGPGGDGEAGEPDEEPRPAGQVRLKNEAGESVYLTEGSANFSLGPGEITDVRLHFNVAPAIADDVLDLEMQVMDEEFWEFFVDDLTLPVYHVVGDGPPVDEVPALDKSFRTRGVVPVRSGALPETHRVATADGVLHATGKLGEMVRVAMPAGGTGWVHADDLKPAPAASPDEDPFQPWISRSPPVVVLTSRVGGTAVQDQTVPLHGLVRDDQAVKDLLIYVNGTKVYYENVAGADGAPAVFEFDVSVALEEGVNSIEILTRDNENLLGSTAIGVYRIKSIETAAAEKG